MVLVVWEDIRGLWLNPEARSLGLIWKKIQRIGEVASLF